MGRGDDIHRLHILSKNTKADNGEVICIAKLTHGVHTKKSGARGEEEEGTSAIERGRKWTESGSRQDIPQKSADYMVDDDDVQLCMGRGINQPKKLKTKNPFQGAHWRCDVIFGCQHAGALRSRYEELSLHLPEVALGCHLRSPPVPENVKRKHENINIEKHHASFPSELCYMRTQECEVCGGRPESASCKFFDRRCYHVMAIKSFQG